MKKLFLSAFCVAIVSTFLFAQGTNAVKVDTYVEGSRSDPASSDLASLEKKTLTFAEQLRKFPTAMGVVIFYTYIGDRNVDFCSKDKLTAARRADLVREILVEREHIRADRINFIDGYLRWSTELEFWIVPNGARPPEATPNAHIHCSCANIEVRGPGEVSTTKRVVTFSANVSGGSGDVVSYRWRVSQGVKIISGQGTPTIKVDLTRVGLKQVTATVDVKGANGCCKFCNETASLTTPVFR